LHSNVLVNVMRHVFAVLLIFRKKTVFNIALLLGA
jgi:hypothetical protein